MQMEVEHPPSLNFSNKRSRSSSPASHERPTKRLFLNHAESEALHGFDHTPPMSLSGSSPNGSRQPSEDWVRQANDLRIDSPRITDTMNEALQGTIAERYPITDEDVMMDVATISSQPMKEDAEPLSSEGAVLPLLFHAEVPLAQQGPSLLVVPSVPRFQPQGDPKPKPRMTMGPRAGCEKCQLGVKGHWMHLS
ncbi:hypothetical protein AB1N83_000384 [Pleurotus pulmonarius]|nr:hypothetical protein EYR36_004430 [Pleurotus pulmonarius]KAF4579141.1 hypothetical protein EYR36_000951 [Pleurotus pulmonarius]KAF4603520.1 hypothetical protein EYR38_003933 [Pleurotus pulmonarius]